MRNEFIIIISVLVSLLLVPQSIPYSTDRTLNESQFVFAEATPHDEIVITHNDNFTSQGWVGNGTVDDPFLISGLEIKSNTVCINITNTDVYFLIANCTFTSDGTTQSGYALSLESVQNGEIRNCFMIGKSVGVTGSGLSDITFSNITIHDSGLGVLLEEAEDCNISNSTFIRNAGTSAISLYNSDHCEITNNQVVENRIGVLSNSSDWITVTNNTIVGNSEYGIRATSGTKKLSVYWNKIGWNGQNAADNGSTKFWDNGNQGNWWSDYNNESDYFITGSANAKDRFPEVWVDDLGPQISTKVSTSKSGDEYSLYVSAEIIDDVATKQAILSISVDGSTWTNVTMDWTYAAWVASVDDLSADTTIEYVVYASDYAGNWEMTSNQTHNIPSVTDTSTTSTTTDTGTTTTSDSLTATLTSNSTFEDGTGLDSIIVAVLVGTVAIMIVVGILMYQYPSKFRRGN